VHPPDPVFFSDADAFRRWLEAHHGTATEVVVGYHKVGTGQPSMTWPESVAEALCFGWIDGIRRRIDDSRYSIRFTPRKRTSTWSAVNVRTMERLVAEGRVHAAGLAAYAARSDANTGIYSYERGEPAVLTADAQRAFQAHAAAWAYFQAQPPSYRRTATHFVVSAVRPETRAKRLALLIACSAKGERLPQLRRDR